MYNYIYNKTEEANKTFSMFENGDKILVALSGGADSVALLLALKEFYPSVSVYACHINHMLRGKEADRDMDFVNELCNNNGIPVEILKTDVAAYAVEHNLSTELAARNVRYTYFEEVCKKHGINKVATAHTLSDNAETVLFNLTRGTGLKGLCGIPAKRPLNDGIEIIRPLILVGRNEIENYLASKNQTYVTDSSNLTDDYTRNYFRHNIIPLLKKINPSFEESLGKTCASVYQAQAFINKVTDNNVSFGIQQLSELDDCILSGVIIKLYNAASGDTLLEKVHIDKIADLIRKSKNDDCKCTYEICLPANISCIINKGIIEFVPTKRKTVESVKEYCISPVTGLNHIDNTGFAFCISDSVIPSPAGYSVYSIDIIDKSKVSGALFVRNRRSGDTIKQGGMTKKVKELLIHKKIPVEIRGTLPFICDDTGIVCIPGIVKCDAHKSSIIDEVNKIYIYIFTQTTM